MGLVASLNRPGGNTTGISTLNAELTAKRLGLLRELVPQAASIAVLLNPSNPNAEPVSSDLQATARTLGMQVDILHASTDREIDAAFANLALKSGSVLLIGTDPSFFLRRFTTRHAGGALRCAHDLL